MLLNHQYKPEAAIHYLTQFYKTYQQGQQPLPLVIGFSYIFQDIYVHLYEATKFQFDQQFVRQITQIHQSTNKQVSTIHLFGPNRELCLGSIEYIASELARQGVFQLMVQQACSQPESGVVHFAVQQIVSILANYLPFNTEFAQDFLSEQFFKEMRSALVAISAGPGNELDCLKRRVEHVAKRTSLDALVVHCVRCVVERIGQANGECLSLARTLEIKEALGM